MFDRFSESGRFSRAADSVSNFFRQTGGSESSQSLITEAQGASDFAAMPDEVKTALHCMGVVNPRSRQLNSLDLTALKFAKGVIEAAESQQVKVENRTADAKRQIRTAAREAERKQTFELLLPYVVDFFNDPTTVANDFSQSHEDVLLNCFVTNSSYPIQGRDLFSPGTEIFLGYDEQGKIVDFVMGREVIEAINKVSELNLDVRNKFEPLHGFRLSVDILQNDTKYAGLRDVLEVLRTKPRPKSRLQRLLEYRPKFPSFTSATVA